MTGSAPKAPDYAEQARVQGESNVEAARTSSKLSNPNMITPYGSQTVTYGDTAFDQAGYDSAMAGYQERLKQPRAEPNRANFNKDYTTNSFDRSGFDKATDDYNTNLQDWSRKGEGTRIRGDWYPSNRGEAPNAPNADDFQTSSNVQGFDQTGYDTALNRYNAGAAPLPPDRGNFMGTTDGGGDQDIPTVRQTLSPASQSLYDQELRVNAGLGNTAERGLETIDQMLGTPFDNSQVRGKARFYNPILGGRSQYDPSQLRDKEQFDASNMRERADFDTSQLRGRSEFDDSQLRGKALFDNSPLRGKAQFDPTDIRNKAAFDDSGLRDKAQFDDSNIRGQAQSGQQAWNNAYNSQMQRNQPFQERTRDRLTNQLSNQGIFAGSEAFGESMRDLERQENDFNLGAQNNATAQQQAQFAMDMQGRQNDQQEAQQAFARDTQGRGLDFQEQQNLYGMDFQNRQNDFSQQQQKFGMEDQARATDNQEQQQAFARATQNRGLDFQEAQNKYGMGLQNRQQDFQEAQNQFGMNFQGRANDFQEQQAQYARGIQGRAQDLNEQQAGFGMGLQGRQNDFAEQQARFGMDTQSRQDDISQQAYLRQLPLNELNALRMGNQIQNPQFQGFQGQSIAPAPMMQAANAQYNAALDASNAKNAAVGNLMSGGTSLASAGMGMAGMFAM